ncbi:MAG: hypothetical protein IJU35_04945 [Paludibacteraceae bacterium]|nr:hypothetical protein [Paludibacteraceae bacterium]
MKKSIFFALLLFLLSLPAIANDRSEMNIRGNVTEIYERSKYLDKSNTLVDVKGGLFDNASFFSAVYSNEHMGRAIDRKWFMSQISDCEIQFNEFGNIISIKSVWEDGGEIYYSYDRNQRVRERDARSEYGNQNEGVTSYNYEVGDNGKVVREYVTTPDLQYTIKHQYDNNNQLIRSIYELGTTEFFFTYISNQLRSIVLKGFWGDGIDASFKIEYNTHGDISSVTSTGKRGAYESERVTTFEYQYDSYGNWIYRQGRTVLKNGVEYNFQTTRSYTYK